MITKMIGAWFQKAKRMLAGFTPGQKAVTLLGALAIVLGAVWFSQWASKPSYAPLFSNLSGTDASAIADLMTTKGVSYQLADGGATILVPQEQVYQARLDASAQGLPSEGGTNGSSSLLNGSATQSEAMQQVSIQNALEAELAKTIGAIQGVNSATVKLGIPKKDIFSDNESSKPTASVQLTMQTGRSLDAGQVNAISSLVSHAVPELAAGDVSITDDKGMLLSAGGGDTALGLSSDRLAQTRAVEQQKAQAAQSMLDRLLGPGNAVVKVSAELDWDQSTTKSTKYAPNPSLSPIAESQTLEKYTGSGDGTGGLVGPAPTVTTPAGATSNGANTYNKSQTTINRVVNTTVEERTQTPGKIKRLAVSVVYNNSVKGAPTAASLQTLVANAVGLDATRGDIIGTPQGMAFASAAPEAPPTTVMGMSIMSLVSKIGIVLAVLLTLVIAFLNGRRNAKRAEALEAEVLDAESQWIQALRADRPDARAGGLQGALDAGGGQLALESGTDEEDDERMRIRAEVKELVERQPEEVATLLRGWLADRRH